MDNDIEILETMRGLLKSPDSWMKGARCVGGKRCLVGAYEFATTGRNVTADGVDTDYKNVEDLYANTSVLLGMELGSDASFFNDARSTTHEMVLARIDARIDELVGEAVEAGIDSLVKLDIE